MALKNDTSKAQRPAELLLNETVGSDWLVVELLPNSSSNNDGQYSTTYIVKRGVEEAFMKVVDLADARQKVGDYFKESERITKRVNNEKEISELCSNFGMKNVVRFIEAGEYDTKAAEEPIVHFIIYERAKNDGRDIAESFGGSMSKISISKRLTLLHNTGNALRAMHEKNVIHQDIKPSNILEFEKDGRMMFKVGDFDCAIKKSHLKLTDELNEQLNLHAGTYQYAPIELLYEYVTLDWDVVRKGTDYYLYGSLICYYFTGRSITEMIGSKLSPPIKWEVTSNKGKYMDLLNLIEEAFELCIDEIAEVTAFDIRLQNVICQALRNLCHPNPEKRGEIAKFGSSNYRFTLKPTISKLGHLMSYYKGI